MNNIEIGYKIVKETWVDDDFRVRSETKLVSLTSYAQTTYKLDRWIDRPPGCGPLTVFENFHFAKRYQKHEGGLIFKCKFIRSVNQAILYDNRYKHKMKCKHFPSGTILADRVKLLEEVT